MDRGLRCLTQEDGFWQVVVRPKNPPLLGSLFACYLPFVSEKNARLLKPGTSSRRSESCSSRVVAEVKKKVGSIVNEGTRAVFFVLADSSTSSGGEWHYVFFRGRSPQDLTKQLQREIGGGDIVVCTRHPCGGQGLYPVKVELPPGCSPVYLVVLRK